MSVKDIIELEELDKLSHLSIWLMTICLIAGAIFMFLSIFITELIGFSLFYFTAAILFGSKKSYYDMKYNLIKYKVMKVK